VSSAPFVQAASHHQEARASEIEGLADNFLAFIEEFEAALSEGHVPPAFQERLAQLQKSAERQI
jgi:molecular chaperone GrpE (heat shock protein)